MRLALPLAVVGGLAAAVLLLAVAIAGRMLAAIALLAFAARRVVLLVTRTFPAIATAAAAIAAFA